MIRSRIIALAALAAAAVAGVARADNYSAKDGSTPQNLLTFCAATSIGIQHPCHVMEAMVGGVPMRLMGESDGSLDVTVKNTVLPIGAATHADMQALITALGAPLQAGPVTVNGGPTAAGQTAANGSLATVAANTAPAGLGPMAAVPAGSTAGAALGAMPSGGRGARFYLGAADSVTFTVAGAAPSAAPAATFTISGAAGGTGPNWDESLSGSEMIYVTAVSGSPKFRWY